MLFLTQSHQVFFFFLNGVVRKKNNLDFYCPQNLLIGPDYVQTLYVRSK